MMVQRLTPSVVLYHPCSSRDTLSSSTPSYRTKSKHLSLTSMYLNEYAQNADTTDEKILLPMIREFHYSAQMDCL